jgi:signal transduction histidine kinase
VTRSLRSRLIAGMLSGMAVLLAAASTTIYAVQRRQLCNAFDEALLNGANSLALLVHSGPFGNWFDAEGLARLSAGEIRQGALFQLWSDQPIHILPPQTGPDAGQDAAGPMGPWDDQALPEPAFPGPEWLPGPPPPGPEGAPEEWPRLAPGVLIIRSPLLNGADLPRLDSPPGKPRFEKTAMPDGAPGRAVGLQFRVSAPPPPLPPTPAATLTAVVAAATTEIEKQLNFLGMLLVATAVGTMAVSAGAAWLVVSRGLRPLAAVARRIATMDETGLKQRLADCGVPREIAPVVSQLNGLLARLDEAFDRERALTTDVAHELRTPVAEIRAIAEVTLSRARDPGEYRQALGETLETIKALQGLVEKLLILARLEAGQRQPEFRRVALKPLLDQHWAQMRDRAESRGVTFWDRCPTEAVVSADASLLEVVLSNVLSNAVAYVPDGGRITVEAQRAGARCQLSIANSGCALNEGDVARVFDRFWRADAARSRSGLSCGLGLTVLRRAMEAMGGKAEASVSADRWFILTLTFDAAEPDR